VPEEQWASETSSPNFSMPPSAPASGTMGLCGSTLTEEQRRAIEHNKQLEQVNANDYRSEQEKMRLLLLGAGVSATSDRERARAFGLH
jgi:hypothetical protein